MGTISREVTAPIVDAETASGTEVEAEFNKLFNVINGSLDNANVASGANISGAKLADSTITGDKIIVSSVSGTKLTDNTVNTSKMLTDTITLAKIATGVMTKVVIQTATGATAMTASSSFTAVPDIAAAVITPAATTDMLICMFSLTTASSTAGTEMAYEFAFDIDAVDTAILTALIKPSNAIAVRQSAFVFHAQLTGTTSAMTITPRHRKPNASSGTGTLLGGGQLTLVVATFPIKQ